MQFAKLLSSMLLLTTLASCSRQSETSPVVVSVYDRQLLQADLAGIVPTGMTPEDSLQILTNYVDQWVRQTVLLTKAEKNVETDFSRELQQYHDNLLAYAYERQIVDQLLDTHISAAQIRQYYDDHRADFRLKSSIVKAVYVTVPRKSPILKKVQSIILRPAFAERDVVELEEFASRHHLAGHFDPTSWMPFYALQRAVPITTYNEQLFLRQNRSITLSDDSLTYCIRFLDYKVTDDESPLELQKENIRSILLNLRKNEIIDLLHADLLAEAERGGHVKKNI